MFPSGHSYVLPSTSIVASTLSLLHCCFHVVALNHIDPSILLLPSFCFPVVTSMLPLPFLAYMVLFPCCLFHVFHLHIFISRLSLPHFHFRIVISTLSLPHCHFHIIISILSFPYSHFTFHFHIVLSIFSLPHCH